MMDIFQKQRILVVDDDKQIAGLVRQYLEQAGFEVLVAYDGETAVSTLRRESIDAHLPRPSQHYL